MAKTLASVPRLLPADDLDYAAAFAALAEVHSRIQQEGLDKGLLLRRAHARYALGNYLGAAFDAERVAREDTECVDAHYLKGQACLAMAAVKQGLARPGIGVYMPAEGLPSRSHLVVVAQRAFEEVLSRNPDDQQAQRGLSTAREMHAQVLASNTGALAS